MCIANKRTTFVGAARRRGKFDQKNFFPLAILFTIVEGQKISIAFSSRFRVHRNLDENFYLYEFNFLRRLKRTHPPICTCT